MSEQLLVIKLGQKLDWNERFVVVSKAVSSVRNDRKGLHRLENGLIEADFGNSEARLIMHCFDDPEHKSVFQISLRGASEKLEATPSNIFEIDHENCELNALFGVTKFLETRPISFNELSFELSPKKEN